MREERDRRGHLTGWAPLRRLRVAAELDTLRVDLLQGGWPFRWQHLAPTRAALLDLATPEPLLFHFAGHGGI